MAFSPQIQKLVDEARRAGKRKLTPPARKRPAHKRCTLLHEGERINIELSTAKTCPPGFFALMPGVHGRSTTPTKSSATKKAAPVKRRKNAKKVDWNWDESAPFNPKPERKKRAKKAPAKRKKASAKKTSSRASGTSTGAKMQREVERLYATKQPGKALQLIKKMKAQGYKYKKKGK